MRVGSNEIVSNLNSVEYCEDSMLSNLLPQSTQMSTSVSPPLSPNIQHRDIAIWEPLELQLEYWPITKNENKNEKSKIDSKISLKGIFRNIHVTRSIQNSTFNISFSLKEKKQKSKFFFLLKNLSKF